MQNGHLLLISREHRMSFQELTQDEKLDLLACQEELLNLFKAMGRDITLAINNAGLMDQGTHFHQHFIPREKSDGFWESI
ncbi:HIT family protein [Streptococcus loxodontisalivarius]|uniref:HIT family protein n=1 Tax=Streptococcus loxodontisalivarius TaxID=1349415 RepID=UPI003605C894